MDNEEKNKNNLTAADLLTTKKPLTISTFDWETTGRPKNYFTAIDYITAQSGKLNTVTNQINILTSPTYQPSILTAVSGVQSHLSTFSTIQSYLPKVDHLVSVSHLMDLSRQATIAISGLTTPSILTGLAASVATNYQPW